MKKLLSVLLAVVLFGTSMAVGTNATLTLPETDIDQHSLVFELPVVTGIEVEWNGEILLSNWLELFFTPENVAVTVHFEEGEPQVLTSWSGGIWNHNESLSWNVWAEINRETGIVTIFYTDSNIERAFREQFPDFCCSSCNPAEWAILRATIPQDSFTFPMNYREMHLERYRPFTTLALDRAVTTQTDSMFVFTVAEEGIFRLTGTSTDEYLMIIFDANFELWDHFGMWDNMAFYIYLVAGTYYFYMTGITENATITITQEAQQQWQPSLWQRIVNWFWDIVWTVEDLGWRMSQNPLGRILISPFVALFWIVLSPLMLFGWLRWGGWPNW